MARSRNIKPGFFTNEQLSECDPLARILFAGLWCIADREGRLYDRPKRIKAELLPYDACDACDLLSQLHKNRLIIRYSVGDEKYIQIVSFTKHQDPHYKEKPSEIPPPDGHQDSGATGGGVSEDVRQAVFDRDGRKCLECGTKEDLSLDHVIPRSKGGTHDKGNLRTLCRRCNSAKNNRQAKNDLDDKSSNDRSIIDRSLVVDPADKPPLIPSSLIPDSGFPIPEETVLSGKPDEAHINGKKKLSESCLEVLTFLNEKTGRNYQPVKANINLIAGRLREGATVDQCRQVIAKKCREWRDDPSQEIYLRPKTLFNATNFANYQGELVP